LKIDRMYYGKYVFPTEYLVLKVFARSKDTCNKEITDPCAPESKISYFMYEN
jgi:hypothetical protein